VTQPADGIAVPTSAGGAVAVIGIGMTDMSRRDMTPEQLAHQAVSVAMADAGVEPGDLSLVIVGNATGGRLNDQGCIRGQSWLRKGGLGNVAIVNVDNSCAGGATALHLGTLSARAAEKAVLIVGVEKMWTGDRAATLAGIEDGLPADYRSDMHERLGADPNPAGSILMGLNARWASQMMVERGTTLEQIAAAAVKARRHGARNPLAQHQYEVTLDEVLESPTVALPLTRLMCSSFTDGAAAAVLAGPSFPAAPSTPRIVGVVARSGNGSLDYHDRLAETARVAWDTFGFGPKDVDCVELHDATSAEELYSLECLGFFEPGAAGPATLAGHTTIGGRGLTVNPSGGLVGRGHPLGATGIAQVVELVTQLRGTAAGRQVQGARLAVAVNTGGIINRDAGFVGMAAIAGGR
jgi:acetyl-CoA acetyltransferase